MCSGSGAEGTGHLESRPAGAVANRRESWSLAITGHLMPNPPDHEAAGDEQSLAKAHAPQHEGVALCLSGGGFRAALFHLGALRRLNELGILSQVEAISSVSGGSVVAAHLAERVRVWPARGEVISD